MSARLLFWVAAVAALILVRAPAVHAHAILLESSPARDATVAGDEIVFKLRFNSRIDHVRSGLALFGPGDKETKVPLVVDGAPADELSGKALGIAPGKYRLRWQVLAVDGHITRGDVEFTVRAP
jgi:hypothetical protein